jgi:F-type H+-transporting ATPase subunit epsilon
MVVAPAADGEITILPSHVSLITTLRPGELRVRTGQDETDIAVSGGFLEVVSNRVTVLADQAEQSSAIDVAKAEEALGAARQRVAELPKDQDLEKALSDLRAAESRVTIARRAGDRRRPPQQR